MNRSKLFILSLLCTITTATYAQSTAASKNSLRVLMIGNSFSGNASKFLPALAASGKHDLVLERAEMGGCSLQRHWDSVLVNNADSLRGRAYGGRSLKQMLMKGKFDVVSLQQYSMLSGDSTTYQPYAKYLCDMVKKYQPQARILIHETWPYRQDAKTFGQIAKGKHAADQQEMYNNLKQAYSKLSRDLSAGIIPSGDAFYLVGNQTNWGFKKDKAFDPDKAVYPALPTDANSLNVGYYWNNKQKLQFDANHANDTGCYLAGLVWYSVLFNEDPSTLSFKPEGVDEAKAAFLRKTAFAVSKKAGK